MGKSYQSNESARAELDTKAEAVRKKSEVLNASLLTLPQKVGAVFAAFVGAVAGLIAGAFIGAIEGLKAGAAANDLGGIAGGIVVGAILGIPAGVPYGAYKGYQFAKYSFFTSNTRSFHNFEKLANQYVKQSENEYGGLEKTLRNFFR